MSFKKTFDLDNAMVAWPTDANVTPLTAEDLKAREMQTAGTVALPDAVPYEMQTAGTVEHASEPIDPRQFGARPDEEPIDYKELFLTFLADNDAHEDFQNALLAHYGACHGNEFDPREAWDSVFSDDSENYIVDHFIWAIAPPSVDFWEKLDNLWRAHLAVTEDPTYWANPLKKLAIDAYAKAQAKVNSSTLYPTLHEAAAAIPKDVVKLGGVTIEIDLSEGGITVELPVASQLTGWSTESHDVKIVGGERDPRVWEVGPYHVVEDTES